MVVVVSEVREVVVVVVVEDGCINVEGGSRAWKSAWMRKLVMLVYRDGPGT